MLDDTINTVKFSSLLQESGVTPTRQMFKGINGLDRSNLILNLYVAGCFLIFFLVF